MRRTVTARLVPAVFALVYALAADEVAAQALTVAPANPNIVVGQTVQFTVTGVSPVTDVEAGSFHSCALLQDNTAVCWGMNDFGQLGRNTTTPDGSANPNPEAVVVDAQGTRLTGVTAISGGGYHTCALLSNGTLRCWGLNTGDPFDPVTPAIGGGQLGNPGRCWSLDLRVVLPRPLPPRSRCRLAASTPARSSWAAS
jgi:Regulator of chromosome condensation (RCC1) repeat